MRPAAALAYLACALALGGCQDTHYLLLALPTESSALECVDEAGAPLIDRAAGTPVYLVLDVIPLPATTSCLADEILAECDGCQLSPLHRRCTLAEGPDVESAVRSGLEAIQAMPQEPLPEGAFVVRVVGTTEDVCGGREVPETLPPFSPDQLVGCLHTCPVDTTDAAQGIPARLGFFIPRPLVCTEDHVGICANFANVR